MSKLSKVDVEENWCNVNHKYFTHLKIHDLYIDNSYITNVYINDIYNNNEFLLASNTNSKLFKIKLCYLTNGPKAMIVYN
tara:strand:- start:233 stop:472 length:240 start_codon:yes stop_codon:yes gene_type:complete